MRLLLLGVNTELERTLRTLFKRSRHVIECRDPAHAVEPAEYDVVLVEGSPRAGPQWRPSQDLLRKIQERSPRTRVVVLNLVGAETPSEQRADRGSCGAVRSGDGVWQLRCRLREIAIADAEALLHDGLARAWREPISFEYQG